MARGLITTLPSDKDNLFVILTARELNPKLRIVSRAIQDDSHPKLRRAGADAVVSANQIGGLRMASEMIRIVCGGPAQIDALREVLAKG